MKYLLLAFVFSGCAIVSPILGGVGQGFQNAQRTPIKQPTRLKCSPDLMGGMSCHDE